MTERGLPGLDGAPACPFVAFGDDREGRSTSPDHRHRCFAESPPAPRAVAHQEAYCLSSAFPVCPTFQDWAKREAAHARGGADPAETAPSAIPISAYDEDDDPDGTSPPSTTAPASGESTISRNPPRDWAAPPPWASGGAGRPSGTTGDVAAASLLASKAVEGQGLAGSAADRMAGGPDAVVPAAAAWSASGAGAASTPPDDELAGLVQGRPTSAPPPPALPASDGYPPPTRTGRRPAVSSTRSSGDPVSGPSWERMSRAEAYPKIRRRTRLPRLSRIAALAGAIGIAALVLFMLPALFGLGGGGTGSASPSPIAGHSADASSALPTVNPGPTPQVYVVKKGDTMSKIAKTFGVTIEDIMAANPDIKNANTIALGQQIIIPAPTPADASPSASPAATPKATTKATARPTKKP